MVAKRPRRSRSASLSKWRRRIRWARRALVLGSLVASARKAMGRSGGSAGGRPGGGAGRPSPSSGPSPTPRLAAARTVAAEDDTTIEEVRTTVVTIDRVRSNGGADPAWVEGGDGVTAPDGYPVKVNTRSGIYHEPGGRNYERTRADRWYRTAEAAEADGYRASRM